MLKLTFIADTHHYSKTLGTDGRQYELRSGSDQKCLAETGDIIDAAFEQIGNSDTDFVLIAGDVTNDGEMVSHQEFRDKLYKLSERKKVYLITATHDWCNDLNPRRYDGDCVYNDVPTMTAKELPVFYEDFGPKDAISKFITHIGTCSYVVQLNDKVRLLALNDDKNEHNHAGFTEEHFCWIEEQLAKAKADGCLMIGMEHHLLVPHISPLITGGSTCVADREYVASRFADAGLKYMFVGHSHIQNTDSFKSANGNVITEVNIGSLVGYPAPIVNVIVNDDMTLSYNVDYLEKFMFDDVEYDAREYLKQHALAIIHRLLDASDIEEFGARLTAMQLNGDKMKKLYPVIKPISNLIKNGTVLQLYKKLKFMGLAKSIDKELAYKFKNYKVIDFFDQIFLSAFDGGIVTFDRASDYYLFVMSVISI
ncbi:MAG: metallophosphoesterase, partial [Eubacterium sp.]|nr:metallophosphoesterase [Eubacterium sp.]